MNALADVHALFAAQHGVVSVRQVRKAGISADRQATQLRRGAWEEYSPGVIALVGVPKSFLRSASAATLCPGGAGTLAAGAAGRVHELDGCLAVNELTIVVAHNCNPRVPEDVKVIRSRRLTAEDISVVNGIRVTSVALTLLHLHVHGPNGDKALDSALHKGHKPDELRADLERWCARGVAGPHEVLAALEQRASGRLPRSWLQRLAKRLLAEFGLRFEDEWPLHAADGKPLAEFDLALVALKVGVECQSWEWHGSPAARIADTERKRRVRRHGWEIVEVWWSDLDRIDAVVLDIRLVLERAQLAQHAVELAAPMG
jgi:hypothetical protein